MKAKSLTRIILALPFVAYSVNADGKKTTECTANIKSDAPARFIQMNQYYDSISFEARAFKNGILYYLGPRFNWVPEHALRNLSEGCKYLREWNPGS